jgi:hypothetical protein
VTRPEIDAIAVSLQPIAKAVCRASIPNEIRENNVKVKDLNEVLIHDGEERVRELINTAPEWKTEPKPETTSAPVEAPPSEAPPTGECLPFGKDTEGDLTAQTGNAVEIPTTARVNACVHDVITVEATKEKPTVEGIPFPDCAWRGIFKDYRDAFQNVTEAPEQFHFAVLATVAGIVIGRSAYMWHGRKLFPVFYSVLIGPTSISRKTTAAEKGVSLLADTDENGDIVGADPLVLTLDHLSTPQGLLAQLKIPKQDEGLDPNSIEYARMMSTSPHEGIRALIVIDEFASLLWQAKREAGTGIIQLLTSAYNCPPELSNPTKVDPIKAKNPTIAMICASTRDWLERTIDQADIAGGYFGRHLFYEWTPTEPIPIPAKPNYTLLNRVTMKLQSIRRSFKERGYRQLEYNFDREAEEDIEYWYIKRHQASPPPEIIAAATARIDENVRKLALLYAVLENEPTDLFIHADQLQAAIAIGEYWEATAISIFGKLGFSKAVRDDIRILEFVKSKGEATQSDVHQGLFSHLSADAVKAKMTALTEIGRLKRESKKYKDAGGRTQTRVVYKSTN